MLAQLGWAGGTRPQAESVEDRECYFVFFELINDNLSWNWDYWPDENPKESFQKLINAIMENSLMNNSSSNNPFKITSKSIYI